MNILLVDLEAVTAVTAALAGEAPAGQRRYWERRRAEWQAASSLAYGNRLVR